MIYCKGLSYYVTQGFEILELLFAQGGGPNFVYSANRTPAVSILRSISYTGKHLLPPSSMLLPFYLTLNATTKHSNLLTIKRLGTHIQIYQVFEPPDNLIVPCKVKINTELQFEVRDSVSLYMLY